LYTCQDKLARDEYDILSYSGSWAGGVALITRVAVRVAINVTYTASVASEPWLYAL